MTGLAFVKKLAGEEIRGEESLSVFCVLLGCIWWYNVVVFFKQATGLV